MFKKLTIQIIAVGKLIYRIPFVIMSKVLNISGIIKPAIKFYQYFISPNFGRNCRFYPSCSEYSYQAVKKYGLIKGFWLAVKRIFKCHPWAPGGIDLP